MDTIVQMRALPIQVEQSALTTFVDTKMALLTPIPEVKIASLSWLHPEDDQELSLALLAPEDGADFDLTIEVEVLCCVCDHPLNSLETKLSWSGPKRGVIRTHIAPVCLECLKDGSFLDYCERVIHSLSEPRHLTLVSGSGSGEQPNRDRSHLRIVRADEVPDDEAE